MNPVHSSATTEGAFEAVLRTMMGVEGGRGVDVDMFWEGDWLSDVIACAGPEPEQFRLKNAA